MEKSPIVTVEQGQLQGKVCVDHYNKPYYSFQGIPYAQAPIGKLRFKAPQKNYPWLGVRDATREKNSSYSRHMLNYNIIGDEDCLYLNVYTPEITGTLKPVMFWIHGGGYLVGSGNSDVYSPDFLVHEDVVIVTINYRLGLLGFLSLNDPELEVPGNAGLKDQVMALKWVASNIDKFGGDPNNITIFGESVGGGSVHYLMLSPMSKGLFHKAIIQSGSAIGNRGRGQYSTPLIIKALGLPDVPDAIILKALQIMPVEKVFEVQEKIPEHYPVSEFRPIGVVVEQYINEDTFLSEEPIDIIRAKRYHDVPVMIGYNSREGYFVKGRYNVDHSNGDFEKEIQFSLNVAKGTDLSKKIAKKIKDFFYGDDASLLKSSAPFILLQGDNMFIRPLYNTARIHAATSKYPVYLYRMSIDSKLNLFKHHYKILDSGVSHGDDLGYLFKNFGTPKILPGSPEDNGVQVFSKYWTTFAKTGNPNPTEKHPLINVIWKPVEKDIVNYVDIGENVTVGVNPEPSRMQLWQDIEDMCSVSYK
ncbi:hypothetical protein RN001_012424 [Aquatica leii]|uniref:Carboxylesterase type B domain-containing protein n=1 Tax=Aquatica leii TaxID=1421715 RepID=A0AAN7SDA8_9COLE|nr:hypothetical protein RN001_012424 [Aquatica leii]